MIQYDKEFLTRLNKMRLKTHYAKIIILSFDEKVLEEIQGEIINGTINVNSSSAIRRTISLNMIVKDSNVNIENTENQISINKKLKVEIGLQNPFSEYIQKYGEIVWFPQGVFILSTINSSRSASGWNLNITAKDKMSLLDGSAGGTFPAPTVLHDKYIYHADGSVEIQYPVLREIIYEAVNHYGGESPSNIIINDLPDSIKMLVKYDGFQQIYYYKDQDKKNGIYTFSKPSVPYTIVNTGEDVGYKLTDFTYPGELVLNPGDTVVTLLDKMVNILGNYEYFYDIDGHFIFQEIKNYVNQQSPLKELTLEDYVRTYDTGRSIFSLTDLDTAAAITQTPKYDNIKNDFYVWGQKPDNHPIHYHLAIDVKPERDFVNRSMQPFCTTEGEIVGYLFDETNQIIKIKAGTVLGYGSSNNIQQVTLKQDICYAVEEILNNNQYYSLKNPEGYYKLRITTNNSGILDTNVTPAIPAMSASEPYEWREELYRQALYLQTTTGFGSGNNYYYEELIAFWRDLYDPTKPEWNNTNHWNPEVENNPNNLDFWFDLIDTGTEIGKYSVQEIGRRTKTINNKEIKAIYNKEAPDLIFIQSDASKRSQAEIDAINDDNQEKCWLPDSKWDLFSISSTGTSCFDEIRNLLYQHLNYHTTISINCLPVYYLEPNNLLYVEDIKSGIIGNFQITQFSLPLAYNGTMNITATEVFQRI